MQFPLGPYIFPNSPTVFPTALFDLWPNPKHKIEPPVAPITALLNKMTDVQMSQYHSPDILCYNCLLHKETRTPEIPSFSFKS